MRQLHDFECQDCGEILEKLVDANTRAAECLCGGKAIRMMSMPTVRLEGITGDFPGASDRWARIREERHRVSAKKSYAKP